MAKRLTLIALLLAAPIIIGAAAFAGTDDANATKRLTAHEWGTFTSIAGPDGTALDWTPAGGPTDLPCFVSTLKTTGVAISKKQINNPSVRVVTGKVRMETPVIYFYAPNKMTVDVKVRFPQGLITEWYPAAAVLPEAFDRATLLENAMGEIHWSNVKVLPEAVSNFHRESTDSHYYAARATDAAPVQIGTSVEKFLFYRGIANFPVPISAKVASDGKIEIENTASEAIPAVVLFENRGGKIGYRVARGAQTFDPLTLNSDIASLRQDLETLLEEQGMYPKEAKAMIATWNDSWFEQGARVFYIVPAKTIDRILPLEIQPTPASVARAFVGRMEIITQTTQNEVSAAISNNDEAVFGQYGRYLEPIVNRFLLPHLPAPAQVTMRAQANPEIQSLRAHYSASLEGCNSTPAR